MQLSEANLYQCAAEVMAVYKSDVEAAGILDGIAAFRKIVEWLKANDINLGVILAHLSAIIAILASSDDWATKIQRLIELFFPGTQPSIAAPGEG